MFHICATQCSDRQPHVAEEHLKCGWSEQQNVTFYAILSSLNLNANSHTYIMATLLNSSALEFIALPCKLRERTSVKTAFFRFKCFLEAKLVLQNFSYFDNSL